MGGSPSISGGMTQAEYRQMLDEQEVRAQRREKEMREFYANQMKEQEEKAKAAAEEAAAKEKAKIAESEKAEEMLQQEAAAQAQAQEEQEEDEGAFDFYGSLYQGLEERPE